MTIVIIIILIQGGSMKNKSLIYICIKILFLPVLFTITIISGFSGVKAQTPVPYINPGEDSVPINASKTVTEEVLHVYPLQRNQFDFDGDGVSDNCLITCKLVKDYSDDASSTVKKKWYQFKILVSGKNGKIMHEDLFSSAENDYMEMFERFGLNFDPDKYIANFFNTERHYGGNRKVNDFSLRMIEKKEVDMDFILDIIKKGNTGLIVDRVVDELTSGRHMVVQYMGDWAEDVRIFAYSRELGTSVRLYNDYEMN
jgi:hypothetical protein